MGKIFVIAGKSSSGKDTIKEILLERNRDLKNIIPYTTRKIRNNETEGKEYHFVTIDVMEEMKKEEKILECRKYNSAFGPLYYFTALDSQINISSNTNYILLSTIEGFKKIKNYYGEKNVILIYIEVDDFARLERAIKREKEQKEPCLKEMCRRFVEDEEDFSENILSTIGYFYRIENDILKNTVHAIEMIIKKEE